MTGLCSHWGSSHSASGLNTSKRLAGAPAASASSKSFWDGGQEGGAGWGGGAGCEGVEPQRLPLPDVIPAVA